MAAAQTPGTLTTPIIATAVVVAGAATLQWVRRWIWSGCAIETIAILYGHSFGSRILPSIPLWTLLATMNVVYAVCATSWLLHGIFAASCYPALGLTFLFQFQFAADYARKTLRKTLQQLQFTRDKIALFNLPALEIDTEVDGLFVVRGLTISLSSLTITAHGIELAVRLADDIELAMHAEKVVMPLFRRVEVGHVYGNIKGGKPEMLFSDLSEYESDTGSDIFVGDTPLLRAATAGSSGFNERSSSTAAELNRMKDVSAKDGFESIQTLSPDDQQAEKQYHETLSEIDTTSGVHQSRQRVLKRARAAGLTQYENENHMRAAMCAELQEVPGVIHPPKRLVRVTTLQNLSSPAVRRFLHRLPFLYRLLLAPISYFHPVTIKSINMAGSGKWLTALLQQKVFKHYVDHNAELRRLAKRVSAWLADANFCIELTDIEGRGAVPLSSDFDIVSYLHFADIMAYRTVPQSDVISQVVRLGGADATITLPSFLLPHHEHILPPEPTQTDEEEQAEAIEQADGAPKTVQAERELKQLQKDETNMVISVHGTLPACFSQSLLNFIAALVKATKIVELEKQADEAEHDFRSPRSPSPSDDDDSVRSMPRTDSSYKSFTKNLRQGFKDGSTREAIREFARDVHHTTRDNMKKAVVGGIVNDRWIAKMVGKVATRLETAQGDLGYSGDVPIALAPYRANAEPMSKLLP